jgi:hypothetical protein
MCCHPKEKEFDNPPHLLHHLINWKRAPLKPRSKKVIRERRHPNHVIQASINNKLLSREFWMSYKSFIKHCSFLYSDLKTKAKRTWSDAIHPKSKLLIAFLYFAGGSHLDLIQIHGIGRTMCYIMTCIQKVIYAVLKNHVSGQPAWPFLGSCWTNMRTQTKRARGIESPDAFIRLSIEYD